MFLLNMVERSAVAGSWKVEYALLLQLLCHGWVIKVACPHNLELPPIFEHLFMKYTFLDPVTSGGLLHGL